MPPSATIKEIKKQYRKLASQYHPDRNPNSKDTFLKVTEAGEVLGDENKKQMYDQSYGLGNFKRFINSKTTMLTLQNYERLVSKSYDFWIVQVFDHESSACASFADSWEQLAQRYKFLKFGRVEQRFQQKLLTMLPFRPLEFPFVFVTHQDSNPEFIESIRGNIPGNKIIQAIKDTLPTKIQLIEPSEFVPWVKEGTKGTHLIFMNRNGFDDLLFLFESNLMTDVQFASTKADYYGLNQNWMKENFPGQPMPKYVLVHGSETPHAKAGKRVEFFEDSYAKISNYIKYLDIPTLSSNNINRFCRTATNPDDETEDRVCIILGGRSLNDQMKSIHTEMVSHPPGNSSSLTSRKFNDGTDIICED